GGISGNSIKTLVTSTTVSFNWSILAREFSVSVSLNNTLRIIQQNDVFSEWDHLMPATLYTFTFEFKQLQLEFINVFQAMDIQVETVPSVPENFVFNVQDVNTTEAVFVWSDLNGWLKSGFELIIKYYFDDSEQHFERLPLNTTHTTIVQLSPGRLYTVLLSARSPRGAQTNLSPVLMVETRPLHSHSLEATHVSSTEIYLEWDPPENFSNASFHHYLVTILDAEVNTSEKLPVQKSTTSMVIRNIKSYHQYKIYLQSVAEKGSLSCSEKPILITTAVSPPSNVVIHPEDIQEESVILHWTVPQEGLGSYIQVKPTTDVDETVKFLVNTTDRFKINHLVPGMTYEIAVATVNNGNMSELKTIQCTLKPKPVQIIVPYDISSNSVVLFLQMPDVGVFDGIYVTSKGGPNAMLALKNDNKVTIENLIPGTEYDFYVSTISGNMLSSIYHVPGVKTCLGAPINVHEGKVTDTSIQIVWDRADGNFQQYEVTCTNCAGTIMVQKVMQEMAVFSNLIPGMLYNFTIRTEKEGFKDSLLVIKEIETDPDPPADLQVFGQEENTVYLSWKLPRGGFEMFQLSYCLIANSETLRTTTVYGSRAIVKNLTPGMDYLFQLKTIKGLDSSMAVEKKVTTKPAKPEGLKAFNVSSHSFSLNWRLPYGYVERFRVDLIPGHGFVTVLDLGGGEYRADFSSVTPGTTYNVTVSSVSSSAYSSPVSRTVTTNVTYPGPPVFLAGEKVGSAGILLSWNVPPHPNGRIVSYIVKYKEVCPWMQTTYTQVTTKPDSLEVLLTNLNPGTTYEIKVAAENSAGIGVFSDPFLFQTAESAPGKVVNLTVEALNYSAVNLIWFLPQQPNGKITSFKISVKHARSGIVVKDVSVKVEDILSGRLPECNENSESFLWSTTTPSTTFGKSTFPSRAMFTPSTAAPSQMSSVWSEPISFVVTRLRPYTTYLFEVSAVTTEAGYIDSTIVRTPEAVPEDPPQNFAKGNITGKSFSVSWEPPTIVTGKFSYRVELYGPSGYILDNSTKDLKFTFNNLTPFTTYDVSVSAETSAGMGPKSNLTVFTPPEVPGAVSDLQLAEIEATLIRISWRKPQQPNGIITQYRVKVLAQDTGLTVENTILTGKVKHSMDSVDPDMLKENIQSTFTGDTIETATGLYEGSAEMFPMIQTVSSVTFSILSSDNLPTINGAAELPSVSDNQYVIISSEQLSYTIKGLTPFIEYTISVSAFTIIGEGPPSVLTIRTREQVPSSVQNIYYKNISSSSVLLYWDPPANPNGKITHYTIYAMELDTKRAFHMTTANNSFLITGLKKYTNYKMRVAASTTVGESALSEENDFFVRTPEDVPDSAPENITYRNISSTEVELSFFPPSVPNGIIQKYTVYLQGINGTELRIINTTLLTISITGLKKYTKYTVEVSASTSKGEGVRSAPLNILTNEDAPSSPPQSLSVKQLSGVTVKLSWKQPLEPNGIILYYTVYVWNTTSKRSVNVTETSLIFTDLENNNEYKIYITTSTRFGDGNIKSSIISFRTSEGGEVEPDDHQWMPLQLTQDSREETEKQIREKWDREKTADEPVLSQPAWRLGELVEKKPWIPPIVQELDPGLSNRLQTINMCGSENFSSQDIDSGVDNKSLSAVLNNLAKCSYYTVWLTADTAFGNGNKTSEIMHVYTDQDIPDGPVESLTYQNVSSTAINVSWLPPSQPNGIVFFLVSLNLWDTQTDSELLSLITYNTSVLLDKLEKYTDYILKIIPATAKGSSKMHTVKLHIRTEEDVPESSPVIRTYKNLSSTSVMLSWDPPRQPNGIIISYDLKLYGPERNDSWSTSNNSIILEDLLPFTLYSIFAAARTIRGLGPYATFNFYTDESVPLAPPQNLTIFNYTAYSVWLKWRPSPQPNGAIKSYSFKIHENKSQTIFYQNVSGSHSDANLFGLEPFSTYFISVCAFTRVGNGNQFSNIVQFTTKESAPDVVQNVQCTATSWQSILVHWDPPSRSNGVITHYIIIFERNSTSISAYDKVHTFRDLLSNISYQFKIKAATSAGEGKEQICNASTFPEKVPSAPRDVAFSNIQSTSVTLAWRTPHTILGYFQNYKITTQLRSIHCSDWENNECIEYEKDQYSYETSVDDYMEEIVHELKKFRWYRFKVAASTNAGYGNTSPWISTQTLPGSPDGPPENVTVVVTSPHSINISWSEPDIITGPTFYLIDITSVDSDDYKASFLKTNYEGKTLEISDLKSFTRYSVVVTAFTGDVSAARIEGKSSTSVIVSTFEAVPKDPPNNVTFQKIPDEVTKFQVMFVPPSEPNGKIQVYQAMIYKEDDPAVVQIHNLSVIDKTNKSVTAVIEGLKGGHTYNVTVYAINGAGAGPKIQLKITMDIKEPPRPNKKPTPVFDTSGTLLVTATTITIRMPVCYYNDDHGPIKKIQVLVAEAGVQHDGNVTKWYDAYFKKPRPYFTNEGFPNPPCTEGKEVLSGKEDMYVIGADTTCMIPGSEDKICNGPLKPRKQYLFKFRATNVKGQFTDSDYSDPVKTLGEGLSERAVEIILAVTLCILSIILLVVAIYAFARIRQKQKEGGTYSPRDAEIIDTKFKLDQLITVADLELKDERFTRPISKKSFLQHVEELCTDNNLKFQEEFSELPKFLQDLASTDADLPWNRSKNRFPNIKPYNNNRVKLIADAGIPGSDYINASYVSGYLCPNEFIATQGPLPGTVGDFWRMVWETRAKTLVMLTQCFEKGRVRCHQYWPEDNKPVTVFGDIVITKLVEDIHIDWTIRDLKIERHGDCMMVRQCNFTAWPEHGVPETTAPLIHFVKLIRASRAHDNTPMIVHCSAGVGRTGVYIALDHLTQHINYHDFVDIYGLVAELRSERMCMVQNLAQYIFLHQCVLDLLTSKGSSQSICFVNYSALQKMDSLDAMEGDVELEWEETTM
ncbi:Phosphotidylinositol phosphatase PTPRQ, partial [Chelonia mydas]